SEMGTVQYQYVDASGKALEIKRDFDGKYQEGTGDIMEAHQDGMYGTIYTGKKNPEQANKKKDYRREPLNNLDNAGLKHDQLYDELKKENSSIKFATDKLALPADKAYVQDLKNIIFNKVGETGAKNTTKEKFQAAVQIVLMKFYTFPKQIQKDEKTKE
ncbi:MAG: hypothetical protein M3R27_16495, partial [Bacteroidota bacterium]|nr:hypothetical protein [Bacteroidota bacterium]